jgi:propionyl-CoA carboxylase beta chain
MTTAAAAVAATMSPLPPPDHQSTTPNTKTQHTPTQEVRAYEDKFYTPLGAARHGFLDDIIRPSETRQRLIRELRLLKRKNIQRPWKKHGNIPL